MQEMRRQGVQMLVKKYEDGDFVGFEEVPDPAPAKKKPSSVTEKVEEVVPVAKRSHRAKPKPEA